MSNFARMAKRHSEQLINSVLNLEDLAECIMLSDVNGFIVELDDPSGQVSFGLTEIPVKVSYLNGTPFLRGRYLHRNRTVNVIAAGDDKENILFALTLASSIRVKHPAAALAGPAAVEKRASVLHANEIAKMKHKTGVAIYRINRVTKVLGWKPEKDDAFDLQIIRANQATLPFLDMRVEKSCCGAFMHWLGLTYHPAQYACYKRDQFIGTVRPKVGLGLSQVGYVVKFENVPSPAHISKTTVLAAAISLLLHLGPINISDDIEEEE